MLNVLMVRHSTYWAGPLLERAGKAYLVVDQNGADLDEQAEAPYETVYRISSYDSLEELSAVAADLLSREVRIDKVASYAEFTQYAAAYLANLLGLEEPSTGAAMATRDKRLMKFHAAAAGLRVPRSYAIPDLGDVDLAALESEVGYPMIVKPASGWGTTSTVAVHSAAEFRRVLDTFDFEPGIVAHQLIAEEFIDGEEFHIDAIWRDGEPWVFFVSRYFVPRLELQTRGGLNGSLLLREKDHADLYARARAFNKTYNDTVGIDRGVTHLEVFFERSSGELVFSEMASRLAGANIVEVIAAACGEDERTIWAHELTDGDPADLALTNGRARSLGWLDLAPDRSGVITGLPSREDLMAHPNVLDVSVRAELGERVHVSGPSTWCVMVVLGADSDQALIAAADELTSRFPVLVD